jgi:hypothetical protein
MIGKKQVPSTLLGIAFEARHVQVAHVHRSGESFQVLKTFGFELSESPMIGNAQTLGAEIREALQNENIRENRCVVALPVQWVLSLSTKIPELPDADVHEFLNLEAERSFAYDPESLFVSSSRLRFASGDQYANIAGVQREQITNLQSVLQAARLKPLSFTVGLAAIQKAFPDGQAPELMLALQKHAVEVGIASGETLFAMRSIEQAEENVDADGLGRELRVTLGQLPGDLRARLVNARLFGSEEAVSRLKMNLAPRLRAMGLEPQALDADSAAAAAGAYLLGRRPDFEFLPPRVSAWKQFAGKTSARKLGWAAGIAGALILLIILVFIVQGWQLSNLQSRWASMSPRVTELEDMQQQIKKFRPWFDESFRSLSIFRKLTEAFPADGAVTAKTLEIRNGAQVNCSGVAKNDQAYFKMLDQLRSNKEVVDVKYEQIHGKSPLQFNFSYRWVEGGSGEH